MNLIKNKIIISLIFFIFLVGISNYGFSKKTKNNPKVDPIFYKALKWRCIGPYRGGRVVAVAGHPSNPFVFYFGATGGGVWKTENGGITWENISDGFFKTGSVGAIAVSESDPNVIYVGMGESCPRGNISHGDGVYKSTDGGKTWQHLGLEDTRHIAKIKIHPKNPDIVYVAALGHIFGPNKERGVYRSIDGGKTWEKILFKSDKAGAIDLAMDPNNPRILYATFWEVQRYPWGFKSGGPDTSIYKSKDGGRTWKEITNNPGLPKGLKGRIGITVSPAKPDRVWAIIEAKDGGVFRSDDGGETWKLVSKDPNLMQRPWYYSHIVADPKDPETVYVLNVRFWKSNDGGKTYTQIRTPHGDNHDLWIDPMNPLRMIEGNDGGATITFDGGKSWSSLYTQPTAQFYHVTTDNQFPYRVYGAQQDNSTISIPSRSDYGAITRSEWYSVGGCESGYIAITPDDPNIVYAGCYGGTLTRYDNRTKQAQNISVWPDNPMGWGAKDLKYRFQWTFPILISPHNPNILYVAGNHVFKSINGGMSWEVISPDLTRNDKSKMESSGGPITKDNTSVEYYCTIFALAESPVKQGILWAGTDDGLIHISVDKGKTWKNVTPKNFPEWGLVSIIEPSHFEAGTAYIAVTRYKFDDFKPYIYKTTDYGKNWIKITKGIPEDEFTRVVREDPERKGLLYAGTEKGVYVSFDDGENWQSLQLNLPVVPIHDMVIHENDLIVATHGRSFWILDDINILREIKDEVLNSTIYLFKPKDTIRFRTRARKIPNAGENPPSGVKVYYYFKEKPKEEVKLSFLDKNGEVIKTFSSNPEKKKEPKVLTEKGTNCFIWDMRYPDAQEVKHAVLWAGSIRGPLAPPGDYFVELIVGGKKFTQPLKIIKDPRVQTTQEEFEEQFAFLIKIRDKLSQTHDAINEIRNIRHQLEEIVKNTKGKNYEKKISQSSKAIEEKLLVIEDELIQYRAKVPQDLLNYPIKLNNKLAALASVVSTADAPPTKQSYEVFEELSRKVDEQIRKLKEIIEVEIKAFNNLIKELNVPAVILKFTKKD